MDEKKVKVKILPLHNIGGIGNAGDVVWMTEAQAEIYIEEGYVEIVNDVRPSTASGVPLSAQDSETVEDHVILKPRSKRKK